MSKASDMAEKLGIRKSHLYYAINAYKKARAALLVARIDPKAQRVAILFVEEVDRHFAQQKLSFKELNKLREIAHKLYEENAQKLLY